MKSSEQTGRAYPEMLWGGIPSGDIPVAELIGSLYRADLNANLSSQTSSHLLLLITEHAVELKGSGGGS